MNTESQRKLGLRDFRRPSHPTSFLKLV